MDETIVDVELWGSCRWFRQ